MKQMPSVWLDTLTTFDATLEQIDNCLAVLKENAQDANFLHLETKRAYSSDVIYMKQFFEKAEVLVRGQ